ncbi:putative copper-exporting P-type ATPase A [uncultured archaeon]|nr:putative copper-exporting P-type ATPase A [uncultured archaeon]
MQSVTETIKSLKIRGLSESEVQQKQTEKGFNELPKEKKKSFLRISFEAIKEPMFILLIVAWLIYIFLGDIEESFMMMGFFVIIIGITIYQENKTEKALEALRDLSSPRALVVRDGISKRIPGREVVEGDIVILSEGDRVPADAVVIASTSLRINESLLTGESVSVTKKHCDNRNIQMKSPGGENSCFVYSGTLVVGGQAIVFVKKIGIETEMGKIGKSLGEIKGEKTNLEKETKFLVKNFAVYAILICLGVIIAYGILRNNWLEATLNGITLAMATIPEEFPVILTLFLGLGAWRMSKKNVLIRRQQAISELGSVTVLCADKTGTLTANMMNVKRLYSYNQTCSVDGKIPEDFKELIDYGILASQKEPFDPMEQALKNATGDRKDFIHKNWELLREYPLSDELLAVSHVWTRPGSKENLIAAKGAPESIIDLCHLRPNERKKILEQVKDFSKYGLRVIGVAKSTYKGKLPSGQHDFTFDFVGLVGFEDPVRKDVPPAIKECYDAGIRVIMITGDYSGTAQNIAKEIGLNNYQQFITGEEINSFSDVELAKRVKETNIFVRVVPQQKLRLVNALKNNGEIVVMTGDGVNDAPALKSANVGVAMGKRGTDVAREAASIVLLDDDFSSIVNGVMMGRRVFDNIRKAMAYVFSIHIPIIGITILSLLLGWPLILLPAHILFMELIIDPASSVVFEAEKSEPNIMKKKPRDPAEKIFNKPTLFYSIILGIITLAFFAASFYISEILLGDSNKARAISFSVLIFSNLFLILNNRSLYAPVHKYLFKENKSFWFLSLGAAVFLGLSLYLPILKDIFKFGSLSVLEILTSLGVSLICLVLFEIVKYFYYKEK